jgi:hypothetical protein
LVAGSPLAEREWDHANRQQQKQVKGAPKKMRFNVGISLFFQFLFNPNLRFFTEVPVGYHLMKLVTFFLRKLPSEVLEDLSSVEKMVSVCQGSPIFSGIWPAKFRKNLSELERSCFWGLGI